MTIAFVEWLDEELRGRRWKRADLARATGMTSSTMTRIFNGERKPGPDLCNAIADALDLPPETVFRKAGLLPELPEDDDQFLSETIEAFKRLSIEERQVALENMLAQLRRQQKKRKNKQQAEDIEGNLDFLGIEDENEEGQDSGLVPG